MSHFCRLMQIPRWMRLFAGAILLSLGALLFLTPIPGGLLLTGAGAALLLCASPRLRRCALRMADRNTRLSQRLERMFRGCGRCENGGLLRPSSSD